jgi:hypothetical protein
MRDFFSENGFQLKFSGGIFSGSTRSVLGLVSVHTPIRPSSGTAALAI